MKAPDKIYIQTNAGEAFSSKWTTIPFRDFENTEYIRKDALMAWIKSEMERLWELLPDADNPNPTQMETRYLGQYMQMEALEDTLNSI